MTKIIFVVVFTTFWSYLHTFDILHFTYMVHGEVNNYTLDGVSIHPVTTKIQVSFLTQLSERKEATQGFHHEANGDFKTVTEFNGCVIGEK